MKNLWQKKGLIFVPDGKQRWNKSHAQVPVADYLPEENRIRIYYSSRNAQNQSLTSYIEVDADFPENVLFVAENPILPLGKKGTFDDSGIMPSWIVNVEDKKYLYYIGWNVRNTVPYYNSVGLAISEDGGKTFEKFSEGPLWDRNYKEPYFSASSCVLKEKKIWRNWYAACTGYVEIQGKMEPRYHLKYAESHNGIDWLREGKVAIDYQNEGEGGIVKASVIWENGIYKMWYCYRNLLNYRNEKSAAYKIGYAESENGLEWLRKDDMAGIATSETGWDSEMIAYPHVIQVKNKCLMFYNGNEFGKTGFGYAERLED